MTGQMNCCISQVGLGNAVITVPKSQWLKITKVSLSHCMFRAVWQELLLIVSYSVTQADGAPF